VSTRGDRIYDGFTISVHVVAAVQQYHEENYGTEGVLFANKDEFESWYYGFFSLNGFRYVVPVSAPSFFSFEPPSPPDERITYRSVGNVANAAIGYPVTDVVSEVEYWIDDYGNQVDYDTGNGPYSKTVHSEVSTSLDLSGSSGNSIAFSPQGHYAYHYASDSIWYTQTNYQIGGLTAACSSSIHLAFTGADSGGNPLSWDYTSTYSFPTSVFNPDNAYSRDNYTAYTSNQGAETNRYGVRPIPTPHHTREFSASFTYEPAYYFNNA
jgi:hypothetical protein